MSRRFRIEEEKALQLTQEIQEEEDKIKLQKERIFGPIIWRRLSNGIKIQDLQQPLYENAADLILEQYVDEDVIFRNAEISKDVVSIFSFRDKLIQSMKDRSSIVAIDESNEDKLAGVLILKAVKKVDFGRVFSRVQLTEGDAYHNVINFINCVYKNVDIFNEFDCDIYLRYYLLCIHPEYRRNTLGYQLMETGLEIAEHLNISVVMGIFDCFKLQKFATKLGMKTLYELAYTSWSGDLRFCNLGAGNYTCAVMAGEAVVLSKPSMSIAEKPTKENITEKIPRVEKRKMKKAKEKKDKTQ